MANPAKKRKRDVGCFTLSQHRFSDKPVSSSNATISKLSRYPATKVQEFHARCRGFLRFRSLVRRAPVLKKEAKARDYCGNVENSHEASNLFGHKYDSNKPLLKSHEKEEDVIDLVDEDSSIEQAQVVEDDKEILVEEHPSPLGVRNDKIDNFLRTPLLRRSPRLNKKRVEVSQELFLPLNAEEEAEVKSAFSVRNRKKVLHKNSSIEICGETLQCLKPCAWLNDDVINLYLELLKERETRDPQKYFKCHFFNTFFYVKLTRPGYNYEAVRRWTRHKRLGYNLIDCDIIFVPIHGGVHWTLAVINIRECKFLYLDSLNGSDPTVLNALAKYLVDEVKDKTGKDIDVSSWDMEYVKDLPLQQNRQTYAIKDNLTEIVSVIASSFSWYDCGMFMLKYIDFYSRGLGLQFSQTDMPYFRLRTAKEILRLRAD